MGAPPILTPQQRADALAKAATSRKRRAEVKSKIKSGEYTIDTVLELAQIDDAVAKKDWGLKYDFDIASMTKDMLENLKKKLAKA